jgi:hypothetical protein
MSDLPTKPSIDNAINASIYEAECFNYLLKHSNTNNLNNFIKYIEVELSLREMKSERKLEFNSILSNEVFQFKQQAEKEMLALQGELENRKFELRKKYIDDHIEKIEEDKQQKDSSESEDESEEDIKKKIVKYKKPLPKQQKKGTKKNNK